MNGKFRGWRRWIGVGALLTGAVTATGTAIAAETALKTQKSRLLKTQNFSLVPPEDPTEAIPFQVRQPGTVIFEVTTTPPLGNFGIIVRQASANAVAVRKDGPTPLRLEIPVSSNDLAKGSAWLAFPTLLGPKQNLYPLHPGSPANGRLTITFAPQATPPRASTPVSSPPPGASTPVSSPPPGTSTPVTSPPPGASTPVSSPPPGTPASLSTPPASTASGPLSGRYRVSVNGLHVNRETWDTPLQTDGKGDEIFLVVDVQEMVRNNPMGAAQTRTSLVYGDTNGFRSRITAGSRSSMGGIKSGDSIPKVADPWRRRAVPQQKQIPLFVWEGTLVDGQNAVLITPAVWEQDSTDKLLAVFDGLGSNINGAMLRPFRDLHSSVGTLDPAAVNRNIFGENLARLQATAAKLLESLRWRQSTLLKQSASTSGMGQVDPAIWNRLGTKMATVIGEAKDRPIGMVESNGRYVFDPLVITLNYQTAEASLAQGALQKGPGILELHYVDAPRLTGDYTLYVQIERIQ